MSLEENLTRPSIQTKQSNKTEILGTDNAHELNSQHIMNLVTRMAAAQRQQEQQEADRLRRQRSVWIAGRQHLHRQTQDRYSGGKQPKTQMIALVATSGRRPAGKSKLRVQIELARKERQVAVRCAKQLQRCHPSARRLFAKTTHSSSHGTPPTTVTAANRAAAKAGAAATRGHQRRRANSSRPEYTVKPVVDASRGNPSSGRPRASSGARAEHDKQEDSEANKHEL